MNGKKLAFNISTAAAGMIAVATYFVDFFKFGNMAELFEVAVRWMRWDPEDGALMLVFLITFFIAPSILALLNGGLGFALKSKGSGVFSIITGALGLMSASAWWIISEEISLGGLGVLGPGAYVNAFMFLGCLVCGILTLALVRTPVEEIPQNDYYEPPYDQQPDFGYDRQPNYGGYDNASDVTVRLNQDYGSFAQSALPAGSIFCVNGKYRGISFPIEDGERINIGRDPKQSNIIIGEESIYVGRKHCNIVYFAEPRRYQVTVSSSNGIVLANGRKVRTGETVRLPAGTTIALGNDDNLFELR